MKSIFVGLFVFLVLAGCTNSKSVAISSLFPNDGTVVSESGEVYKIVEVDPETTEVRVWLCDNGNLVFDDEFCNKTFGN